MLDCNAKIDIRENSMSKKGLGHTSVNQKVKSQKAHDKWLMKNNCHPVQLASRKKKRGNLKKDFGVAKDYYANQSNNIHSGASVLPVRSIFEHIRTGEETQATIEAIKEKASRVGPAFNKGGMQLLSKDQIIFSGKK